MHLPPLFEDRPFVLQLIGVVIVPMIFGLFCGFALGWHEVLYLVLVGPIALLGGFLGGIEHSGWEDGFVRGLLGGLVFGSFILLGHKIAGTEPKADLPDPQVGLVILTRWSAGSSAGWAGVSAPAAKAPSPQRPRAAACCGPRSPSRWQSPRRHPSHIAT